MKTLAGRFAPALLVAVLFAAFAPAGTDTWCPSVTVSGGWSTGLSVFNSAEGPAVFTLTRYALSGLPVGAPLTLTVGAATWAEVPAAVLNYDGTARVTSRDTLLVRVSYRHGDSPDGGEFYLDGLTADRWVIPNPARPECDYAGLTVMNPTKVPLEIEALDAWKGGVFVAGTGSGTISPFSALSWLSDQLIPGLGCTDFDAILVNAGGDKVPAPFGVVGNVAGGRRTCFPALPARPRPPEFADRDYRGEWTTDAWCSHVTAADGIRTRVSVYNPGTGIATYGYSRHAPDGTLLGSVSSLKAVPRSWRDLPATSLAYEGSLRVWSPSYLLVRVSYQYGDTPEVHEVYLSTDRRRMWVFPMPGNPALEPLIVAFMNPSPDLNYQAYVRLWSQGEIVGACQLALGKGNQVLQPVADIPRWVDLEDVETVTVECGFPLPLPIGITVGAMGEGRPFFAGTPWPVNRSGWGYDRDEILGELRCVRHNTFPQGSPPSAEGCRGADETPFEHTLRRSFAAMDSEVTRQMWYDLRLLDGSFPADPSAVFPGDDLSHPVQRVTWREAVLFANLMSRKRGFPPCYTKDAAHLVPLDLSNYLTGTVFCNFDADGYRLPTEGEWESMCRAGTAGPFSCDEPAYNGSNCSGLSTPGMYPNLEYYAWFRANAGGTTHPAGALGSNGWGLNDLHGNVSEWCWDWYAAYPGGNTADYTGPANGTARVIRGGNWGQDARNLRAANRDAVPPTARSSAIGFRLVRTIP